MPLLVVALSCARSHVSAAASGLPLDVVVRETAGVPRTDTSGTVSVPFAPGQLPAAPALALHGPGSPPWPAAGRVLESWPDGSVRWLRVDFAGSATPRSRAVRRLDVIATSGVSRPSSVRAGAGGADDTLLHAAADGLFDLDVPSGGAAVARIGDGRGTTLTTIPWPALVVDGATLPMPALESWEIETQDPLGAELLLRARHANGLRHDVRLAVFARQPIVRVRYTLTHLGDAPYLRLAAFPIEIPWPAVQGEFAIDGSVRSFDLGDPPRAHVLLQHDAGAPFLDGVASGRHADGVARVRGGAGTCSVAVPAFWQEYPKSLEIATRGLRIDLAAAGDAPLLLGVGAAKTWEFWVAVHRNLPVPALVPLGRSLTTPLRGSVDPARVVASGALPTAITPTTPGADVFLPTLRRAFERYRGRAMAERWDDGPPGPCSTRPAPRAHTGFYGAFNWGDWNFPGLRDETKGCDAWGNLEYDLPYVLGLAWLATGEPELWTAFQDAGRHYRDVDIIHHWPAHPDRVGLNHPHKVRHFAIDAPNTVDLGHVWLEGLLLHFRLTGERRSHDAVIRMADALVSRVGRARNPRQFGWPMVALAAAFEATADDRYRRACLEYAAAALATRFPEDPKREWMMGILAEGMMAAHRATGDPAVRRWLDDYGRRLLVPRPRPRDPRLVVPAGYLFELTGDTRFAALARDTAIALTPGNWGKPLASDGRLGFALLGPLARRPAALTPGRVAPPPVSAREPTRSSPPPAAPAPPSGR